uniref:Protein phosphatase 1b n=1 Tax=Echinococcus granulosus TaxID=6210 RepID=A0A068WX95_ECHGR|nr:protein phosphatase 1b [Echinococcus granulosus]
MGAFLDKPNTRKSSDSGKGNNVAYGVSSMQGWRMEMEDAHVAKTSLPGELKTWCYFGVFDGHAGSRVSELCSKYLLDHILNTPIFKELIASTEKHGAIEEIKGGIVAGFMAFDEFILKDSPQEKSGSTSVVAFVTPTHYFIANCGDSRGVLIKSGKVAFSTEDHKPINPKEHRRITDAGGHVILSRVNGSLAVSRALGDFDYKQIKGQSPADQLVSPEPDVTAIARVKAEDEMLVLACDGVWDVFSNDQLCEYLIHRLKCSCSLSEACEETIDTALFKGSRDNMTMLIVGLDSMPTPDPEMTKLDKELNTAIREMIENVIEMYKDTDRFTSSSISNVIENRSLPNYPPGGLVTKRALIESICSSHPEVSDCINMGGVPSQ